MLTAETLPRLTSAPSAATSGQGNACRHDTLPRATILQRGSAASDIPDQSYWTAYDHYMVEREARAMRRIYVWTMLAKAWSGLRRLSR
jgi:hypothetical protein